MNIWVVALQFGQISWQILSRIHHSAWVRLDKDAKDPISFDKPAIEQKRAKEYRASPPLARPFYRPAPTTPTRSIQTDFLIYLN